MTDPVVPPAPDPRRVDELSRCFERHRAALLRRCRRKLGGRQADAEDAVARAALAMVRAAPALEELRNPAAWLHELARNASIDIQRARARRREASLSDADDEAIDQPWMAHPDPDPERSLLARESLAWTQQALAALPPSLRGPLLLRVEDELPYAEMAERLGDSAENLRKRVQTARQLLRDALSLRDSAPARAGRGERAPGAAAAPDAPAASFLAPSRALAPIVVAAPAGAARRTVWLPLPAPLPPYTAQRHARLLRYVQEHPAGWRKALELADMLFGAGRLDEAIDHYRAALSRREDAGDAHLRLALALEQRGRAEEAALLFDALGEGEGAPASRSYVRGLAERARGRAELAAAHFRRAEALAQQSPAPAVALGALLWARGRPTAALAAFERALAADPDDIAALLLGHDAAWLAGRAGEATSRLARALAADGDSVPALLRLLEHRVRSGELPQRAEDPLPRLRRLAPDLAEVHAAAAARLHARGLAAEARRVLREFVEAHPDDAAGWLACARGALARGATAEAVQAIRRAAELDPGSAEIGGEALRVAALARDEALPALAEALLARFPDHWPIASGAALALAATGGPAAQALALSSHARELEPELPLASLVHGEVLALAGRIDEAMAALEAGLLLLPPGDGYLQAAPALLRLAELSRGRGDAAAAYWYERAAGAAAAARGRDAARARGWEAAALAGLGQSPAGAAPAPAPGLEVRGFCAGAAA